MKTNKKGFDEMQQQRRDRIGHQMFVTMIFIICFASFFIRSPYYSILVNTMFTVCIVVYLLRLIIANAWLPPVKDQKDHIIFVFFMVSAMVMGMLVTRVYIKWPIRGFGYKDGFFELILLVLLFVAYIVGIIKFRNKGNNKE